MQDDRTHGAPEATQEQRPASAGKQQALRDNRAHLDQDLVEGRLRFASKPRVTELQLSNFCNMSCTMCYDGNNPPMKKMSARVVEVLERDVLPTASVLSPFVGSEPLIITWDLARDLAERHELTLDLITNAQYLTEERFREVQPLVNSVTFSIDSHLPDVYERIRLRAKTKAVFENLPVAARLCREHGIEPQANIVFMVENAPFLDETVAYLADQGCTTVRILSLLMSEDLTPDRVYSDALRHFSPDWIRWMLGKLEKLAREKQIDVNFEGHTRHSFSFKPADTSYRPDRRTENAVWDELNYFLPGYCVQSVDHLKVHADGNAYPCCVAGGETLKLGNLGDLGWRRRVIGIQRGQGGAGALQRTEVFDGDFEPAHAGVEVVHSQVGEISGRGRLGHGRSSGGSRIRSPHCTTGCLPVPLAPGKEAENRRKPQAL